MPSTPPRYRVLVVTTSDIAKRRKKNMPRLLVEITVEPPRRRLTHLKKHKERWYSGMIVGIDRALTPRTTYGSLEEARLAKKELSAELSAAGYTVNCNFSTWRVYVIQLKPSVTKDKYPGYFYVGETSKPVEERIRQHRDTAPRVGFSLHSRKAHRHFLRPREDLRPRTVLYSKADSLKLEHETIRRLRAEGYFVIGG
jgi:hypothetical protein